jgi:prophage DNA circulation protein
VSQADAADAAMAEAMPDGGYESMAYTADTQLAVIEAPSSRPSDIEAAVRTITTTIDANLDLADLQTVEAAQAILELERLRARAYDLRDSLLVGLRRANVLTVPRTMSVFELSLQAYGDATQMQLLLDANPAIAADPLFVAPGTIVTIPPLN